MSISDTSPLRPSDGANVEVAAGLRELAAFLEQNPQLPRVRWATVSLRAIRDGQPARETLELVADALADRARVTHPDGSVEVLGCFGPVAVKASASAEELADAAPDVAQLAWSAGVAAMLVQVGRQPVRDQHGPYEEPVYGVLS